MCAMRAGIAATTIAATTAQNITPPRPRLSASTDALTGHPQTVEHLAVTTLRGTGVTLSTRRSQILQMAQVSSNVIMQSNAPSATPPQSVASHQLTPRDVGHPPSVDLVVNHGPPLRTTPPTTSSTAPRATTASSSSAAAIIAPQVINQQAARLQRTQNARAQTPTNSSSRSIATASPLQLQGNLNEAFIRNQLRESPPFTTTTPRTSPTITVTNPHMATNQAVLSAGRLLTNEAATEIPGSGWRETRPGMTEMRSIITQGYRNLQFNLQGNPPILQNVSSILQRADVIAENTRERPLLRALLADTTSTYLNSLAPQIIAANRDPTIHSMNDTFAQSVVQYFARLTPPLSPTEIAARAQKMVVIQHFLRVINSRMAEASISNPTERKNITTLSQNIMREVNDWAGTPEQRSRVPPDIVATLDRLCEAMVSPLSVTATLVPQPTLTPAQVSSSNEQIANIQNHIAAIHTVIANISNRITVLDRELSQQSGLVEGGLIGTAEFHRAGSVIINEREQLITERTRLTRENSQLQARIEESQQLAPAPAATQNTAAPMEEYNSQDLST